MVIVISKIWILINSFLFIYSLNFIFIFLYDKKDKRNIIEIGIEKVMGKWLEMWIVLVNGHFVIGSREIVFIGRYPLKSPAGSFQGAKQEERLFERCSLHRRGSGFYGVEISVKNRSIINAVAGCGLGSSRAGFHQG